MSSFEHALRRLCAATESQALGHGGISLVAQAIGLSIRTIKHGMQELTGADMPDTWVRRAGGGRKRAEAQDPGLPDALDTLVEPATRDDPMTPLRWTSKSCQNWPRN